MDDLHRGLVLVAKGLRDSMARAIFSLGLGGLFLGGVQLFLDQGLLLASDATRWFMGLGALGVGIGIGRRFDARRERALTAAPLRRALPAVTFDSEDSPSSRRDQAVYKLAVELAKLTRDADSATLIVRRAGFPPEHIPEFKTPLGFWTTTISEFVNGRGNLDGLIEEAIRQFPHNRALLTCKHRFETDLVFGSSLPRDQPERSAAPPPTDGG